MVAAIACTPSDKINNNKKPRTQTNLSKQTHLKSRSLVAKKGNEIALLLCKLEAAEEDLKTDSLTEVEAVLC